MQPIPCSERLPEEGERVFFWSMNSEIQIGDYEGVRNKNNPIYTYFQFHTGLHAYAGTHWCEIPEHLKNFKPNEATTHS